MAFMLCPICGAEFQGLIDDPATWYAERYPDIRVGSLAPCVCFDCRPQLAVGDSVVIRNSFDDLNGVVGVIERIATDPNGAGHIYFVLVGNRRDRAFARCNLALSTDGDDVVSSTATKPEGYF